MVIAVSRLRKDFICYNLLLNKFIHSLKQSIELKLLRAKRDKKHSVPLPSKSPLNKWHWDKTSAIAAIAHKTDLQIDKAVGLFVSEMKPLQMIRYK